jgi:hypothetical protein
VQLDRATALQAHGHHPAAARAAQRPYRRREPEHTLLHAIVRDGLEPFLATARQHGSGKGLPGHVERALRGYLDCGVLANGFARVRCPDCGFERLVAFSCKSRICPSCAARRMEDAADHLVRSVLPPVPMRQWVLTLPRRLRFLAARDNRVASRLVELFTRTVFRWQRAAARRTGAAEPRTGAVTFVQRFGGAINLNVHFHTLIPDGVFTVEGEAREAPARFVRLPPPRDEDVQRLLACIIRKVHEELPEIEELDAAGAADPDDPYAALQAAEVDRRSFHLEPFQPSRRSAHLDGFSLHAGVRVHEHDRQGLERLCRYAGRPPLALHRLSMGTDGRLVYRMKRPRGASLFLVLTPQELIARLATLVPPPRAHALRYHGVFAPNAKLRARIVPCPEASSALSPPPSSPPPAPASPSPPRRPLPAHPPAEPSSRQRSGPRPRTRVPWAELLQKVFAVDVLACPRCDGRLEVIAYINEPAVAKQILDHLGLDSQAPPRTPPLPGAADAAEPAPAYDQVDPSYEE